MNLTWVVVVAICVFVLSTVSAALVDMCKDEARARIEKLPELIVRMASIWLPYGDREDQASEWIAELHKIHSTDELPVTRLVLRLRFAISLLVRGAPVIAYQLDPSPGRRVRSCVTGRLRAAQAALTSPTLPNFKNKDLCGADLSGLDLDDVNLDGAIWSAETVWPTGDILDDIRARSCEICPGVYQIKDIDIDKLAFISILSLGPDRVSAMWRGC